MLYFLQGLTVGLAYSAPIGMQNLFIINSALNSRRRRAFLTALIVAFFDIVLSLACFFGVGALALLQETFASILYIFALPSIKIWYAIGVLSK